MNSSGDSTQKQKTNQYIQVYVRVRPTNTREKLIRSNEVVEVQGSRDLIAKQMLESRTTKRYTFDRVFGMDSQQHEVYASVVSPMIDEVLAGYNCTVFAYGQTGTGKTYTMVGEEQPTLASTQEDASNVGIIPRALNHLFDELRLMQVEFAMRVSYLELYNEELCDLLSSDDTAKIRIFDDVSKKGSVIVQGLEEIPVRSKSDVYRLLAKGQERRKTAATLMNAQSSRSHTVFSILVQIKENGSDGEEMLKIGKLNLVDLAGSENSSKAGNEKGIRTRESVNINQSLLTLGRVITALVERTPHIPYRESKLTRLLQESLGGRTKTSIIATVSPGHKDLEETLSTLDYAHRAKNIQNKPEINQRLTKKVVLKEYTEEIDRLKRDLNAAREKNGIYLASDTYNDLLYKMETQQKELNEKIHLMKSLKDDLVEKTRRFDECSTNLNVVSSELMEERSKMRITEAELSKTKRNLRKTERLNKEKAHLVKCHQDTEAVLTDHAKKLIEVATEASSDTYSLLESINRRQNAETRGATAVETMMRNLSNNIIEIRHEMEQMKMKHTESTRLVVADLDEHTKSKKKFTETVGQALKELQTMKTESSDELKKFISQWKESTTKTSESNAEAVLKVLHGIENQHKSSFAALSEKIKTMESLMLKERSESEDLKKTLLGKMAEQNSEIQNFCSTIKEKISSHCDNFNSLSAQVRAKTSAQQSKLIEIKKLLQEVENLQPTSVYDEMDASNEELRAFGPATVDTFSEHNKNAQKDNTLFFNNLEGHRQQINEKVQQNLSEVAQLNQNSDSSIERLLKQQLELMTQQGTDMKSELDVLENSTDLKLKDAENQQLEKSAMVTEMLNDEKSRNLVKIQEVKSLVQQTLTGLVQNAESSVGEKLFKCSEEIQTVKEQDVLVYKPSGQTPARKNYSVDRNLVATSPHDRLLHRFRLENGFLDNSLDSSLVEVNEPEANSTPLRMQTNQLIESELPAKRPADLSSYEGKENQSVDDII